MAFRFAYPCPFRSSPASFHFISLFPTSDKPSTAIVLVLSSISFVFLLSFLLILLFLTRDKPIQAVFLVSHFRSSSCSLISSVFFSFQPKANSHSYLSCILTYFIHLLPLVHSFSFSIFLSWLFKARRSSERPFSRQCRLGRNRTRDDLAVSSVHNEHSFLRIRLGDRDAA